MKLRVHSWRLDTPDSKPTHGRQLVQGRALTRRRVLRGRTGDLRSSGRAPAATSQILCGRTGFRCHAWSRPIRLSASSHEKSSGIPTTPPFLYPLGEEHGFDAIEQQVFQNLMGGMFSARDLETHVVAVHVNDER